MTCTTFPKESFLLSCLCQRLLPKTHHGTLCFILRAPFSFRTVKIILRVLTDSMGYYPNYLCLIYKATKFSDDLAQIVREPYSKL